MHYIYLLDLVTSCSSSNEKPPHWIVPTPIGNPHVGGCDNWLYIWKRSCRVVNCHAAICRFVRWNIFRWIWSIQWQVVCPPMHCNEKPPHGILQGLILEICKSSNWRGDKNCCVAIGNLPCVLPENKFWEQIRFLEFWLIQGRVRLPIENLHNECR